MAIVKINALNYSFIYEREEFFAKLKTSSELLFDEFRLQCQSVEHGTMLGVKLFVDLISF